tara:strand:- start:240 stop:527 length:288 start_codon:yes stop_codon:yes gene_type:complete
MPNFTGKSGGGPHHMKKGYGTGKNPIMLTKEGKDKIMASDANPEFKKAIANSPVEMYGSPVEKYSKSSMATKKRKPMKEKSRAEQKAIFASGYKG